MTHYDGLIAILSKMGYFGYFAKKVVKWSKSGQKVVKMGKFSVFGHLFFEKTVKFIKPCFFLILSRHGFLSKPVQKSAKKRSKTRKMGYFGPFLATFCPLLVDIILVVLNFDGQ